MRLLPFDSASPKSPDLQPDGSVEAAGSELVFRFRLTGVLEGIDWENGKDVSASVSGRFDELWKHTCFEAFVQGAGDGYWEFNLAPNGAWNCYRFDRYREGMRPELAVQTVHPVAVRRGDFFELSWRAPVALFGAPFEVLRVGLTAVIVTLRGETSFWAIRHAGGQPDFHLTESFVAKVTRQST